VRGDLANLHAQQVAAECRDLVGGRYPLERDSPREATIADFGMVFGYDGVFDRFFTSRLEGLVDTSRRPWRWRPTIGDAPAGPAWMLAQFETARYIRNNFFRPGSQVLEVGFRATPIDLDSRVVRFVLTIDGQPIEYSHGPPQTLRLKWPGEVGEVVATFNDRSPVPPTLTLAGNWSLFRLLDEGELQSETEFRHVLTLRRNDYTAQVRLEADSNRNPFFRRTLLQQFRCGS
jgi:type VI secretion system protein ImpL